MTDKRSAIVGILLAAGRGERYDPSGARNKLLSPATRGPHTGLALAAAAARTLRSALPRVIAVVHPGQATTRLELNRLLEQEGCELVVNDEAERGMGTSLACGVRASTHASGWIIGLADMPAIEPVTVQAIAAALQDGAITAAPFHRGQRGHPVGIAAALLPQLLALSGDTGARTLLATHPPQRIDVVDAGILYDVDTPDAP